MRYCLALDLRDDPALIAAYEAHHRAVWPAVLTSLREAGIRHLDIYRAGNRLVMVIEADETFSLARKAVLDAANPAVQQWEALMATYQQPLPLAQPGQKWMLMENIFSL